MSLQKNQSLEKTIIFSLIVPVFNEQNQIESLIPSLYNLKNNLTQQTEIIIIDDASSDGSSKKLESLCKKYHFIYQLNSVRLGKSLSILAGYAVARGSYIGILDADLSACIPIIPSMVEQLSDDVFVTTESNQNFFSRYKPHFHGPKIFPRHVFTHLNQNELNSWNIESELIYTSLEMGYTQHKLICPTKHQSRPKNISVKIKRFISTQKNNLRYLLSHPAYILSPSGQDMIGAGVAYRRHRFVTHSTLPLNVSALHTFTPWQTGVTLGLICILSFGFVNNTIATLTALTAILSFIYLLDVIFNLYVTLKSLHFPPEIVATEEELSKLNNQDLPLYTILVPLYHEGNVLSKFIESLEKLDYPKNKLDIILLLEEDDTDSINIAKELALPAQYRTVIVPQSFPKTKPKACNYGLSLARGEYIVIYDAEDIPDPLQLKKAHLALTVGGQEIGCVQAKLNYFNKHDNLLTRFFTAEYSLWFDVILPGLQSIKTTIPLGGTSNHFRTQLLRDLHGWDAFNVTEDADLGTRLFNSGYQTAIIDSTTLEEANSNLKNWIRQRSRWLKGYMQTYLVHMRHPLGLFKKQGIHALLFNLIVGGKISFILINPFLWIMTISYFALYRYTGTFIESIYPAPVFYMAVVSLVIGNFIALYNYMIGAAKRGHWELIKYVLLIPFYWLAISYAALIALIQLITKPHYWEKTIHGINKEVKQNSKESKYQRAHRVQQIADFARSSFNAGGVMVIAAISGNFMNFLYNSYLSRHLSLEDFGEISLFGSLLYISSVPISALGRSITHSSAFLFGKYSKPVKDIWSVYRPKIIKVSIYASVLWLALIPVMQRYFHVNELLPFILFTPVWIISALSAFDGGFLAGNLFFTVIAITGITVPIAKFLLTIILVSLRLPDFVYASIPASISISFFISYYAVKRIKYKKIAKITKNDLKLSTKFYATSILNTLTSAMVLSLDVVLAKHFLSPVEAGAYSVLSLAGKMVYFLGGMFSQFMIPYVSRDVGANKSPWKSFITITGLVTLVNVAAVLVFGLLGKFTAPILWGSSAESIIPYLPLYSLAMALFSLTNLIVLYQQIRGRYAFPIVAFSLGALQAVGMYLEHESISHLVAVLTIASGISLLGMLLLSRFYSQAKYLFQAFVDFLGLFHPLPSTPSLESGKLRILVFNWRDTKHVWAGGAETYIHELGKRWVRDGNQVTVFCGNDSRSKRHETIDGVRIIRRGGFYLVYFWAVLYYFFRLRGRYDIIIDSENGVPFFTPLYAREKVYLLIHHVHQEVFRTSLRPPFSWFASFLEKRFMPFVYRKTEVITVSPSSKADIIAHKLTKHDPHIVYNGVDLRVCKPGKKSEVPTVLYLGRLTSAKSIHVLIRAAKEIVAAVPRVKIIIAGDGPARRTLVKLTKKLNLDKSIEFTGKVSESEKIKLYQQAWVFVNPSLIEGWGITTIEANACGTPVVASNVAGLMDAVHNPHSGFLVPYGNVEEFSKNIVKLLKNTRTRARMSRDSITWANKFAWDKSAEEATKILKEQ